MFFAGLPLSTLLPIGAAAGALVVAFYILKLRRRPVAVPFSRIWQRILRDKEATTLFSQLKRLLSLLLQLVLLALLLFALGDPRVSRSVTKGRNIVVLVDASASMKAVDVKPSRLAVAKQKVKKMIAGLGGSDRMLIAQMDATLQPLSTMTGDEPELDQAIDQVHATDTRADLRRGLSFALDSLRDLSKPEVVVVSDGELGDPKEAAHGLDLSHVDLRYVPVGKSGKNVAITQFAVRRYPLDKSRYEVMLEVTNTNDQPVDVEITLLGDGQVVDVTHLHLGPHERVPRFYKDLAGASRTLEAEIKLAGGEHDDLPADDRAYALMPEERRARVLCVTQGNTYLDAALLLDEYLDVTTVSPAKYPPQGTFDVTIFDGVAPPPFKGAGSILYLNPPAAGSPVKLGREIKNFGFDVWDRKSPILRFIAPGDIQVAEGNALKPDSGDHVVGASEKGPILVSGVRGGRKFLALGFDPRNSDFVLRVAWPLFVLNSINAFVEEDTSYLSSYRTGEVWRIPVPENAEVATIVDPSGKEHRVPVKQGRAVYLGEQAGFYKLIVSADPEPVTTMFAANLSDIDESRIKPIARLDVGGRQAAAVSGFTPGVRREIWIYLLILVLALSMVEWFTYHRRITV
jgi:von Willebrand factor type A domain/Aerotolerance regulator N-terminal